ncbi:MAG TPA: ATP-binding cassette domain-containing protein [Candidatus Marinimicrobia bacterium]|jgi:simple sugar transport system ATP-binding protein|nr:ATP-binding cassette domain-containing protein [Candidatus Neomarinimicrobiota bacterium]HJL75605.1 ATP-binding cassette domain-containing protein [Candidatus Neomarinimicrobiota bacterium]HJM70327.1 ATP-binding cassette domain-containing protein [Candidatus Neomarinimicrobiota bacterium]|tara:strand:- start:5654 stop:6415 length:762 start_codon:yes stop_codon:yes gene_type:complete
MEYFEKDMLQPNNGNLQLTNIYKSFGSVTALNDVSLSTTPGKIHCILGDNGAGKSTLVNIMSGVISADKGDYLINGDKVNFSTPKQALNAGISTVYQNLAIIPMLSIYRNFFLGKEPIKNKYFKFIDKNFATGTTQKELAKFGITIDDIERPAGTLSGGQRQCLAIARSLYFGAKVLILDEPTSALGVKESTNVLNQLVMLKEKGINIILISHIIDHAYDVGDVFFILKMGRLEGSYNNDDISPKILRSILSK